MPLFTQFRKQGCTNSPVFQFWNMSLEVVKMLFWNIRVEREGNWALHMHTQVTMLPFVFAANCINYAHWCQHTCWTWQISLLISNQPLKMGNSHSMRKQVPSMDYGVRWVRHNPGFQECKWNHRPNTQESCLDA